MKNVTFDIIEPLIDEYFSSKTLPSKPIVSIHTRDQRDTMKIIKTFYLRYPQYRWITFRDMRGLNQEEFSNYLKDSFVSVWVDDVSGFGTFPIESMASKTPVIGKVPNMKPEWMSDDNGIWTYELNNIHDIIAEFIQNWLEDNISHELYQNGLNTAKKYTDLESFESAVINLFDSYLNNRKEVFESQIEKIKMEETN
jgi:glycosyltransferase involved in cell wall biosynthesis